MAAIPRQFCDDVNALAGWLALEELDAGRLREAEAIVYMGNQVLPTLTEACRLAHKAPRARLLLCGGVGHATGPMRERLRGSAYGALVAEGAIHEGQSEAEMAASVVERFFGIERERLLLETHSRNCGENSRMGLRVLAEAFAGGARCVLIQDPTMQRRAVESWRREARLAGLTIPAVSHAAFTPAIEAGPEGRPRMAEGASREGWSVERFLGLVLGEMRRLNDDEQGYGPRGAGFLDHVEIPGELREAWRRLEASPLAELAAR